MSKGKMMFTCSGCGWTVKTPFGEADIMEHSMMHAKKHHPEMVNTPKAELARAACSYNGQKWFLFRFARSPVFEETESPEK
jgi:predicted small metal-binding protein